MTSALDCFFAEFGAGRPSLSSAVLVADNARILQGSNRHSKGDKDQSRAKPNRWDANGSVRGNKIKDTAGPLSDSRWSLEKTCTKILTAPTRMGRALDMSSPAFSTQIQRTQVSSGAVRGRPLVITAATQQYLPPHPHQNCSGDDLDFGMSLDELKYRANRQSQGSKLENNVSQVTTREAKTNSLLHLHSPVGSRAA